MNDNTTHMLRKEGWSLEVINTLCSLGYELDRYDRVTCEGEFISRATGDRANGLSAHPHRMTLHRQDDAEMIRLAIFGAGMLKQKKYAGDSFRSLAKACGVSLPIS